MSNFQQPAGAYQRHVLGKLLHGDEILFSHTELSTSRTRGRIPKYMLSKDGGKVTESLFNILMRGDFFERSSKHEQGDRYKLSQRGIQKAKELCNLRKVEQPPLADHKLTKIQLKKYYEHLDTLKNDARDKGYKLTPERVEALEKKALEQLNTPVQTRPGFRTSPSALPLPEELPLLKSNSTVKRNQFRDSAYLRRNIRARHRH